LGFGVEERKIVTAYFFCTACASRLAILVCSAKVPTHTSTKPVTRRKLDASYRLVLMSYSGFGWSAKYRCVPVHR
jgi:hypothetical protein